MFSSSGELYINLSASLAGNCRWEPDWPERRMASDADASIPATTTHTHLGSTSSGDGVANL